MNREPLTPENAALVLLDHQTGIMQGVQDFAPAEFRNNVLALGKVGRLFELPVVLTTSYDEGPNGPLLPELVAMFPKAPLVRRPGQINAWDDPDFVAAVRATGRSKLIMAGVTWDVCLAFPALSAAAEGFDVRAVVDASGTWNVAAQVATNHRLAMAGVVPCNWVAVAAELQRDWRAPTGPQLAQLFHDHLTFYGMLMDNHAAATAAKD